MLPCTVELRLGPPRWYPAVITCALAAVCLALYLAALEWPFTLLVMALAAGITARTLWRASPSENAQFIRVLRNGAVMLLSENGLESAAQVRAVHWVTPWLVAITILPSRGRALNLVVSRDRNERDAFRRFVVLCRFGFAASEPGVQNTHMPS